MAIVREVTEEDAQAFLELQEQLDEETEFMMFEPGERTTTLDRQAEQIRGMREVGNSTILVAQDEGRLVGQLGAFGMPPKRVRHRVHVVVGVLKSHWGRGIGTRLFSELEKWARSRAVRRLELTVLTNNHAGVALYEKMGFETEGTRRASIFVSGSFVDEYAMAKLLDPE